MNDLIIRQVAIDALNGLIDRFEQILRDIRETNGDDSVCGMCEYDGAYIGQSGDWCNECPGFDKEDCFKLSDKCRKRWLKSVDLPSAQQWIPCSEKLPEEETEVLVTRTFLGCKDGSRGWNNHIPPKAYVEVAQYCNGEWIALSDEYKVARSRHTNPIAWMPLPEPYKGEEE